MADKRKIAKSVGIENKILRICRSGHIGFHEPGSVIDSARWLITLDRRTHLNAAADFFGEQP